MENRSSRSLDRSKVERHFPSPPRGGGTGSCTNPPLSAPYQHHQNGASLLWHSIYTNRTPPPPSRPPVAPLPQQHHFRSQTSPSLLSSERGTLGVPSGSGKSLGGGGTSGKVAIVSMQPSPPSISSLCSSSSQHHLDSVPPAPQPPPLPFMIASGSATAAAAITASTSVYSNETTEATSGTPALRFPFLLF